MMISSKQKPVVNNSKGVVAKLTPAALKSLRYERNYSYIEAMKDDVETSADENSILIEQQQQESACDRNNNYMNNNNYNNNKNKKSLTLDSQSNNKKLLNFYSTTSTSSIATTTSTITNKMQQQQVLSKKDAGEKLSKSQSQSSILSLFKSHFSSPFLLKKFRSRSKSRDKISEQTSSNGKTTTKTKQQQPPAVTVTQSSSQVQVKQPLLIINRSLDETKSHSKVQQQAVDHKKENIIPSSTKKTQQQASLTIKLSNDHLNDELLKPATKPQHQLKSSSLSPMLLSQQKQQQAEHQTPLKPLTPPPSTNARQLSYLQLTCLLNGYHQNNLTIQTSPSSNSSSMITPPKIMSPSKKQQNETNSHRLTIEKVFSSSAIAPNKQQPSPTITPAEEEEDINRKNLVTTPTQVIIVNNYNDEQPKDGNYYLDQLEKETIRLRGLMATYEGHLKDTLIQSLLNDDVLGRIQSAVGKTNLLITQKFEQFRKLCKKNLSDKQLESTAASNTSCNGFVTLDHDLAGFWDMVYLQIDDIVNMYTELDKIKSNNWQLQQQVAKTNGSSDPTKKVGLNHNKPKATATSKVITNGNSVPTKPSSADAARKRLLEAKRNAMKQQQNESGDIVIFNTDNKKTVE